MDTPTRTLPLLTLALLLLLGLAGCGGGADDDVGEGALTGTIRVDGSSTVFPITEAVAEEFMLEYPGVRVTVGVSGTGGGFSKFLRGETDINNASRPIQASEVEEAQQAGIEYIELPVSYDGLAVVINPENEWVECLTVDELQQIWEPGSDVDAWSDVRTGFPDEPIKLYGPGTASGTFDYFTAAVTGEEGRARTDFTSSEDDNVLVQGIRGDENALGFFGLAYYENNANQLKLVGIDDGDPATGEGCVMPSAETVQDGTYQPLARPEFIYVNRESADDPAVQEFVEFYLENVDVLAREVGYVPLSDEAYALALERFQNRTTGTIFEGEGATVGVRIVDLLRQEVREAPAGAPADAAADTTAV